MSNQPNDNSSNENESDSEEDTADPQETSFDMIGEKTTGSSHETGSSHAKPGAPQEGDPSKLPGDIPSVVWSALQGPFDRSDVQLIDVQTDTKYKRGLARPVVSETALLRRLNKVLGPEGWSVEFTTEGPEACRCRLYIGSAFRDAIAEGTGRLDTCLQAFRLAARQFGIAAGLHGPPNIYVEKDENDNVSNFDQIIEDLQEAGAVR